MVFTSDSDLSKVEPIKDDIITSAIGFASVFVVSDSKGDSHAFAFLDSQVDKGFSTEG